MTTVKKVEGFYELWMLDKNGNVTIPLVVPEKEFDEKELPKRCFGYRFFKSNTKNGIATRIKDYGEFIWPTTLSSILSEKEMKRNLKAYKCIKNNLS